VETLLLSQKEIDGLVSMKDVVDIIEKTFQGMGTVRS
jgi:ornithine cyclodeaminase/alanine dehydrogenase-like protein (mu-crystallin family)